MNHARWYIHIEKDDDWYSEQKCKVRNKADDETLQASPCKAGSLGGDGEDESGSKAYFSAAED